MDKQRYGYEGAVTVFGRIVDNSWYGETAAVSEKKARSNLAYQFKFENKLLPSAKVDLPGELYLIED